MSSPAAETPGREALLLRARKRIEEKRLYQKVLLDPDSDLSVDVSSDSNGVVPRGIPKANASEYEFNLNSSIKLPESSASAARYRRLSLNPIAGSAPFISRPRSVSYKFNQSPASLQENQDTKKMSPSLAIPESLDSLRITDENLPIQPLPIQIQSQIPLKIDVGGDNMKTPTAGTDENIASIVDPRRAVSASRDSLGNPLSKKVERLLERGVSITPLNAADIEYTGLSITPATPRIESEQEIKRKGILKKRGKKVPMPDDSPIKEQDIHEIKELQELYSSNSSLTVRLKWTINTIGVSQNSRTFIYPTPFSQSIKITHSQLSPLDGFYVPDTPIIAYWNYDRLLKRLQKTEPEGPWFAGNYTLSLLPDPINHIHYRPPSIDNQDWCDILDHEAALVRVPAQIMKSETSLPPTSLIVDLSGLDIHTHPLMLEEQVLARTLEELVYTMQSRKRTHLVPFLFEKVVSLQSAYTDLKKQFDVLKTAKIDSRMDHSVATTTMATTPHMRIKMNAEQKLKQRILSSRDGMLRLLKEILATRQLRDTEAQTSRLLEYRIIKTWDQIKGIRVSQGFSSTSVSLSIRTSSVERVDYRDEAEKEVMYKQELWEFENIEKSLTFSDSNLAIQQERTDDTDQLLKKNKASKFLGKSAEHLGSFQTKKVRENALRHLKACYPAQPDLEFRIDSSNPVSNRTECPHAEQMRRHAAEASRYYLMLYYNGNLVTKTNPKNLDSKFGLTFTSLADYSKLDGLYSKSDRACFVLSVTDIPRNFKIHVYEAGILGDNFISEVYVPLPPFGDLAASLDRHAGSVDFSATRSAIEGKVNISLAWGENPRAVTPAPSLLPSDPLSFHGPAGLLNLPSMIEWILKTNFDPNDPRNADLMKIRELIDSVAGHDTLSLSSWNSQGFFRVGLPEWLHRMTLGVGPQNLEDYQARFKTLIGRFRKELIYSGPVPLNLEEFTTLPPANPHSLRDETEAKVLKNWDTRYSIKDGSEPKFVDLGFLKRIRDLQMIRKNALNMPLHVDDFVGEARAEIGYHDQIDFMFLFRPFRPLNPYRTNRQNIITRDADRCKLVIQLVSGINLPMRKNARGSKLKPFVELSFQKRTTRSITSEGANPQWNQTLAIEIEAPDGDFRPEALMETDIATDYIIVNVFDEITIDLLQDERERDREMYIRKEKVWLGSIQVPFTSVWERSRIDGKFPIIVPPSLLGYGQDTQTDEVIKIDAHDQSMLHIFVTLDPPLAQPPALKLKFQTDESPDLIKSALKFQEQASTPTKPIQLLTNDMSGKTTLITRFIRPQNPPPSLTTAHQVSRYVSSIPFLPNRTVFAVTCTLWSTADQTLHVGAGDSIDHAVLLCNLLLALDYQARVITGTTLVGGTSAFVIYKNKDPGTPPRRSESGSTMARLLGSLANFAGAGGSRLDVGEVNEMLRVCDPVSGNIYHVQDKKCPLMDVAMVFDDRNVWVNMQLEKRLDKTVLDVDDPTCWRPFNPTQFSPGLASIQPALLEYRQPSVKWIADLEQAIERLVVTKFEEWRKGSVTRWNRLCSRSFKTLITRFEDDIIAGIDLAASIQDSNELNSISRVYKLSGHPLCMPYTDGMAICNAIQSRGIHENVQNGVEFALAVHCVGYPGRFVYVHVFLASLVRS